jgi:hypothetical protein
MTSTSVTHSIRPYYVRRTVLLYIIRTAYDIVLYYNIDRILNTDLRITRDFFVSNISLFLYKSFLIRLIKLPYSLRKELYTYIVLQRQFNALFMP